MTMLLLRSMNMRLNHLSLTRPTRLDQSRINYAVDIQGGRMCLISTRYLLARNQNKIISQIRRHRYRCRIDELIMLRQTQKIITALMIPSSNRLRRRIRMPAQQRMHMRIALVPLLRRTANQGNEKNQRKECFFNHKQTVTIERRNLNEPRLRYQPNPSTPPRSPYPTVRILLPNNVE